MNCGLLWDTLTDPLNSLSHVSWLLKTCLCHNTVSSSRAGPASHGSLHPNGSGKVAALKCFDTQRKISSRRIRATTGELGKVFFFNTKAVSIPVYGKVPSSPRKPHSLKYNLGLLEDLWHLSSQTQPHIRIAWGNSIIIDSRAPDLETLFFFFPF